MKKLLCWLALACLALESQAAPFVISDPWPIANPDGSAAPQPDTCAAVESGVSKPLTLITVNGAKQIRHDLAGTSSGTHDWSVTCANMWGSSNAVNFPFAVAAPTTPAGLRVAP